MDRYGFFPGDGEGPFEKPYDVGFQVLSDFEFPSLGAAQGEGDGDHAVDEQAPRHDWNVVV